MDQDKQKNRAANLKEAGLTLNGLFKEVDVLRNSFGAVYAYNEETEIQTLKNFEEAAGDIRLTDALAGTIEFTRLSTSYGDNTRKYIYTTGSAAINTLTDPAKNAMVKAYWTGKMLTPAAIAGTPAFTMTFDQAEIYTAAQLQGMGMTGTVAAYNIPKDKVTSIWLGGAAYPWIGAEIAKIKTAGTPDAYPVFEAYTQPTATVAYGSAFSFDGENVKLYNMLLDITDPFKTIDGCCGEQIKANVQANLGLIRRIQTGDEDVTIENVNLNDVLLNSEVPVKNVGSLVGLIESKGAVEISASNVTNTRIKTIGDNVGGLVGELENGGSVIIDDVNVESINKNSSADTDPTDKMYGGYFTTEGHNVGGLVGQLTGTIADKSVAYPVAGESGKNVYFDAYATDIQITDAYVNLKDSITAVYGSNVGGLVGNLLYDGSNATDDVNNIAGNTVIVPRIVAHIDNDQEAVPERNYTGRNVGGFVGKLYNYDDTKPTAVNGKVIANTEITAEKEAAGGLIGRSFIKTGLATAPALDINSDVEGAVTVNAGKVEADYGWAGGLIGNIAQGSTGIGGQDAAVTVVVGSLNTAYCGGGLVGENYDELDIEGVENGVLTITINDWKNTQAPSWFITHTMQNYCGTFGNAVGKGTNTIDILGHAAGFIVVNGAASEAWAFQHYGADKNSKVIKNAKKDALYFYLYNDAVDTQKHAGVNYWGDDYGYVGVAKESGGYSVDGTNVQPDYICNIQKVY